MSRNLKLIIGALFVSTLAFATGYVPQSQTVDFDRAIKPIFDAHCISCHGAKKAAGQLRLDNKTAALKGGISGAVIVPNNSKASILLARVTGSDGQAKMPMGGESLTPAQLELINRIARPSWGFDGWDCWSKGFRIRPMHGDFRFQI